MSMAGRLFVGKGGFQETKAVAPKPGAHTALPPGFFAEYFTQVVRRLSRRKPLLRSKQGGNRG